MSSGQDIKNQRYLTLLRRFKAHIVNYCRIHTPTLDRAQDLEQAVCLLLWENIDDLRSDDPRQQNRWLKRVMQTALKRQKRLMPHIKQVPPDRMADLTDDPDPAGTLARKLDLRTLLNLLPPLERRIMNLHLLGFSNREIADRCNLKDGNHVKQRLARIYAKLRRIYLND